MYRRKGIEIKKEIKSKRGKNEQGGIKRKMREGEDWGKNKRLYKKKENQDREFLNEVFWISRAVASWIGLPSIHRKFLRWAKSGK